MNKNGGAFASYLRESKTAVVASVIAILGGSAAPVFKALGWTRPMPVWAAWLVCLAVVVVAQYLIYAKLYRRHENLRGQIRDATRMTPAIRDRIQRIKGVAGQVSAWIQGLSPADRATIQRSLGELLELGSQVGEHQGARGAAVFYVASVNSLLVALDEAESPEQRRRIHNSALTENHKMFNLLVQMCNQVLDRYPLIDTPPGDRPPSKAE